MKKSQVQVGMRVTCKEAVEAYYSRGKWIYPPYRLPEVWFTPGMVGVVGAVDVPSVTRERVSFCCVDFTGPNGSQERCALLYPNIVPAPAPTAE